MEETFPIIIPIHLGNSFAFVIRDKQGCMLIDAGIPGRERKLIKSLQKNGIILEQIKLVVITHVHYDHVGSLAAFLNVCPCTVAVHEKEANLLRQGDIVLPAGTGFLGRHLMTITRFLLKIFPGLSKFSPVEADLLINKETSLQSFGIAGRILPTPGHTSGSLSIILNDGSAFIGDLAFNVYPWGGPIFPILANDVPQVIASWQTLLANPIKVIYPSHGRPFPVVMLNRALQIHGK